MDIITKSEKDRVLALLELSGKEVFAPVSLQIVSIALRTFTTKKILIQKNVLKPVNAPRDTFGALIS